MERRPAELPRIAAVAFLLINFGVIISDSLVIDDPHSTIICIAGNTSYNVSFVKGIEAGVFSSLDEVGSVKSCVRKACNRRAGHLAFLVERTCYMVRCYVPLTSCKTGKPLSPSIFTVSITPYTWFDAAPVFSDKLPKVIEVKENNQKEQIITNIHGNAKSRRSPNASIKYSILTGNTGNAFELREHPLGQSASLVAISKLDREKIPWYNLTILAVNLDENKSSTRVLSINVTDENDNAPVFSRTNYSVTILSNQSAGSEVIRINATDADIGENARMRFYLLHHQSLFRMLPESGTILLNQKVRVDRERSYTLIVAARNGAHKSIATVQVHVLAVNEYRPFFENSEYKVKVSEALKAGNSVTKVVARDFDYGKNGELNFTIIAGNVSYFSIDKEGVVKTRKSLLTHGGLNFSLTIIVSDRGTPPKRSVDVAKVYISIDEIKKHKVKFDLERYHVTIAENTPIGATILTVRAVTGVKRKKLKERRLDKKSSKRVVYSIGNADGNRHFKIGEHTGMITTKVAMDYEKVKEYRLTIFARDTAKKDESGRYELDKADVFVLVLDVNDNAPRFVLDSYQEVISENATVDSEILRVTATDADSGTNGEIHYHIDHGNSNGTFELDDKNGTLKLQQRLTTQMSDFYNLTIFARDHGAPFLISRPTFIYLKVRRSIHAECTEKLKFPKAVYLVAVNESIPIGSNILRVAAKNGKCNPASKVNYFFSEIRDPDVDSHFQILSQTGVIRLLKPLDYEARPRFAFYVGATDIRTVNTVDTVFIRILVRDVNDNNPEFYELRYKRLLTEIPEPKTVVAQVTAHDRDSGKNAELEYLIVSGSNSHFRIGQKTGAVSTSGSKNLKSQNLRLFNITVSVSDYGNPPRKAKRQARLSVLVFFPLRSPLILIETTDTTMTVRFDLKDMARSNIAKYGIIVQEFVDDNNKYDEITEREPLTWYKVTQSAREDQAYNRYITKVIPSTPSIEKSRPLEVKIGVDKNCQNRRGDSDFCNGPLGPGKKYRFQLRAYLKSTGPFEDCKYKDSDFSDPHFTALPQPKAAFQKETRKNYDAVVYSVGTALVLVIILAFLRGFYRLKLDRKRIHEEKKKRISFPMSNPRFQEPNSPVEKIKTPGPAKRMVAVNLDKGSEFSHRDEDEGSSPDSALDDSTRPLQSRRRPTLQEVRLKNYFNSVESSSCASCDHVKIYCVQETIT